MKELNDSYRLIIYDGVCGFCNKWVQFILDNRPNHDIRFVAFQSPLAQPYLKKYDINDINSIVFIEKDKCYKKSTAIFKIFNLLNTKWKLLSLGIYAPTTLRDAIYDFMAKNRYTFLKKNTHCRILKAEEKLFFLE